MNVLAVLSLLTHFITLGHTGPFSRLFCPPRCNPHRDRPLNQCAFSCGFLKYGKYYDGSVCWVRSLHTPDVLAALLRPYFSIIGQAFATTGFCSQGICLKIFTGGYNGSEAQRNCGDIPRDALWLRNMTQSTQRPGFNLSDMDQQMQIPSFNASTSASPPTYFQSSGITTPLPTTTASGSMEYTTLPPKGTPATLIETGELFTPHTPTETVWSTKPVTGQGTEAANRETATPSTNINESEWEANTTEIPIAVLTTTSTDVTDTANVTMLVPVENSGYSEEVTTASYPEVGLDVQALRPSVFAGLESTALSTSRNLTKANNTEFIHSSRPTTAATSVGYAADLNVGAGQFNSMKEHEYTETPIHPTTLPTWDASYLRESDVTEVIETSETKNTVGTRAPLALAESTSPTKNENSSAPFSPASSAEKITFSPTTTTELASPPTELPVSNAHIISNNVSASESSAIGGPGEITGVNSPALVATTTAASETNMTRNAKSTTASLQEILFSTPAPAVSGVAKNTTEATPFPPTVTMGPVPESTSEQSQINSTSVLITVTEIPIEEPPVVKAPTSVSEIFTTGEPGNAAMETSTKVTPTVTSSPMYSLPDEAFEIMTPLTNTSELLRGTDATPANSTRSVAVVEITTQVPFSHLTTNVTTPQSSPHQTAASLGLMKMTTRLYSNFSVSELPLSGITSEPLFVTETSLNTTPGAETMTDKHVRFEMLVTPMLLNITEPTYVVKESPIRQTTPSTPLLSHNNETFMTTTPLQTSTSAAENEGENLTELETAFFPSESLNMTAPTEVSDENFTTVSSATPPSNQTASHLHEPIMTTTRQPTGTFLSEAATNKSAEVEMAMPISESPNVSAASYLFEANWTTASLATPPSTLSTSHQYATVMVTTGTSIAESMTIITTEAETTISSSEPPNIIESPYVFTATLTPLDLTAPVSIPTASYKNEALSTITMPPFVATVSQTKKEQVYTATTREYRGRYYGTAEISIPRAGTPNPEENVDANQSRTYGAEHSPTTLTFTEENAAVIEQPFPLRNISGNESAVTMQMGRSKANGAAAGVSFYLTAFLIAIMLTL
ncbi:hypothetical protein V5799_008205 [Amblyomma americanum]|uniref:Uncharacterized protein n=1 Tax=Amblyomma americanum TaxID=6943 RepID=A0AAQ4FE19_AMBAM